MRRAQCFDLGQGAHRNTICRVTVPPDAVGQPSALMRCFRATTTERGAGHVCRYRQTSEVNSDLHDKKYLRAYTDQQQCEPVALMCVVNVFGRVAMPDISETAGLEVQIEALIRKASDHLRRQLDDFRRNADSRCDQSQELKEAS